MENAKNSGLFGKNLFAQAFREFDEESFFEGLHNQVKNKSYYDKYKGFKITITILSYVFNLGSALTASYAVYWLTQWITGYAWVGYVLAAICLYFLESIKRKSSTELWQLWFFRKEIGIGWLLLSLACFSVSVVSSGFGVKQGTEEQAPDPELIKNDSLLTHYNAEIAKLENKNEDLRNNRNSEGITFYKLADGITANELVIADYRKRTLELEKKLDGKNEKLTKTYMAEVQLTAWTLVWITVAMEILFECCIAYIWYFSFRSFVEREKTKTKEENASHEDKVEATDSPPLSEIVETDPKIDQLMQLVQQLQEEQQFMRTQWTQNAPHSTADNVKNSYRPIGFRTAQEEDTSVITATEQPVMIDDRYTVAHTYIKAGKSVTVHYNMTMVKSRITEYFKKVEAAEQGSMSEKVKANRKKWLAYWQTKEKELIDKAQQSDMA